MNITINGGSIQTLDDLIQAVRPVVEIVLLRHAGNYDHSGAPSQYLRSMRCVEYLRSLCLGRDDQQRTNWMREINLLENFNCLHQAQNIYSQVCLDGKWETGLEYGKATTGNEQT